MKKTYLFTLIIVGFTINSFSQKNRFNLDINYVIPFGDNSIGNPYYNITSEKYKSLIDIGGRYNIIRKEGEVMIITKCGREIESSDINPYILE